MTVEISDELMQAIDAKAQALLNRERHQGNIIALEHKDVFLHAISKAIENDLSDPNVLSELLKTDYKVPPSEDASSNNVVSMQGAPWTAENTGISVRKRPSPSAAYTYGAYNAENPKKFNTLRIEYPALTPFHWAAIALAVSKTMANGTPYDTAAKQNTFRESHTAELARKIDDSIRYNESDTIVVEAIDYIMDCWNAEKLRINEQADSNAVHSSSTAVVPYQPTTSVVEPEDANVRKLPKKVEKRNINPLGDRANVTELDLFRSKIPPKEDKSR